MKYVFFGSPRFAEIILERLIAAGVPPIAIVCNPDRAVGRKKILTPPPTKQLVLARDPKIMIFQPENLDDRFIKELQSLNPDFFVVAAYAKIIPRSVLAIPTRGTMGIHPSLLPKYRGASPIQAAILGGERETGVTLYMMDEKMDHGPVIADSRIPLDSLATGYRELEKNLAEHGADLLLKNLPAARNGLSPRMQDEPHATYTKKFTTDDGRIDEKDFMRAADKDTAIAETIIRKINALTPEPGVWMMQNGKRIKLLKASMENGRLKLLLVQREGEKPRKP